MCGFIIMGEPMKNEMWYLAAAAGALACGAKNIAGFFFLCWALWVGLWLWDFAKEKIFTAKKTAH